MSSTTPLTAPSFDLPGVDGRNHGLGDYADAGILVLIQSCNHCPWVQAWEGRMNAIAGEYADRGVRVVAIASNDAVAYPEDGLPAMIERARKQGCVFDYLYDEDQSVARALGSERTPEVFVFDQDRRLAYHGVIDDDREGDNITQHYLRDSLDALLAGKQPPVAETTPLGCTVKWRS
jgi:peroxiredoxin